MSGDLSLRVDDDRVEAIRACDRGAFVALVEQWVYRIHDVALSIVGSPAAAVEVSREAVESLWDRHHDLSAGFLSIRPGDATGAPSTSSLNFVAGDIVPDAVQVGLPTTGANAGKIDITFDAYGVNGAELVYAVVGRATGTSQITGTALVHHVGEFGAHGQKTGRQFDGSHDHTACWWDSCGRCHAPHRTRSVAHSDRRVGCDVGHRRRGRPVPVASDRPRYSGSGAYQSCWTTTRSPMTWLAWSRT